MKVLAFSDVHTNIPDAVRLVGMSQAVDAVIGVGDFASQHSGLEQTIEALSEIAKPTVLVPGNNETEEALRDASSSWDAATVLHGSGTEIEGVHFFGLGAGVPVTPWDWSFDLSEEEAEEKLRDLPEGAVLASHSPPRGHCDRDSSGNNLGSEAVLAALEAKAPRFVLCGHIHESWRERSSVDETTVINLGPQGHLIDV